MRCCAGQGGPTGRGPGMARVMPTGEKEILLVKNFEIVCVRGGGGVGGIPQHVFWGVVVLDWRRKFKLRKLLYVSFWRYTKFRTWKKSQNSVKFRGISRNYKTRNSAEFRRNFSQFRTEYGIDGSKKTDGIPCRRNSVDTLLLIKCTRYRYCIRYRYRTFKKVKFRNNFCCLPSPSPPPNRYHIGLIWSESLKNHITFHSSRFHFRDCLVLQNLENNFFIIWKNVYFFVTQTYTRIFLLVCHFLSSMKHYGNFFSGIFKCLLQSSLIFQFILKILKKYLYSYHLSRALDTVPVPLNVVPVDVALETIFFHKLPFLVGYIYLRYSSYCTKLKVVPYR
jgi:hypothetical protein